MAVYTPVFVDNKLDLYCAIKNNTAVIITKDRELFSELDKEVTYSKSKRLIGNIGIGIGAAIGAFLTLGAGVVIAGGSACPSRSNHAGIFRSPENARNGSARRKNVQANDTRTTSKNLPVLTPAPPFCPQKSECRTLPAAPGA